MRLWQGKTKIETGSASLPDISGGGMDDIPRLLTPREAADRLRVSTKTLRRLRASGLPFITLTSGSIRYDARDLADFVGRNTKRIEPKCPIDPKVRATGTTTSKSGVIDFMDLAGPTTSRKRRQ
ncbi:hypothetical protein BMI87_18165 [Thioclava sp. F28-4]|nr:hypothetical protein BMI87_18165 [Thioclava sp. F28-4]